MDDRRGLTFAQAEGAEDLPRQLLLREISPELRAILWAYVHESLSQSVGYPGAYSGPPYWKDPWKTILKLWWIVRLHKNADEEPNTSEMINLVKSKITKGNYIDVFDFLQFVIQSDNCPYKFAETIDKFLSAKGAAYRVVDRLIVPISTDEEADAARAASAVARQATAQGPYAHLRTASRALSEGKWSEVVRESTLAVEAAAKSIEPKAATLGPALDRLRDTIGLNPALAKAYKALYGYSSDEKGIRHALVFDGVANVGEHDATFMFGACLSFVSYLLTASRIISINAPEV